MRALSVKAPWAQFIVRGTGIALREVLPPDRPDRKDVENRSWFPPAGQLAPGCRFAIHCSKGVDREAMALFGVDGAAVAADLGCVIGTVVLDAVHGWTEAFACRSPWHARDLVGWYVRDAVALSEPVPARGRLGLWEWARSGDCAH